MTPLGTYFKQAEGLNSALEGSKEWLEQNKDIKSDINSALIGFNELVFAIPIFGGSGDKFTEIHPWHHLFFEAEQDLDSAILLLLMGFYKDSFRSLRSFLELQIFALYHFVNEDKDNFQEWLHGKAHTPKLSDLSKALPKKNSDIQVLNEKLKWDKDVESLYKELSGFIHTRGAQHTHSSLRNSNITKFSETGIKTGTAFLLRAIRLAGMGFAVNFPMSLQPLPLFEKFAFNPPAGGFLSEDQVERVRAMFPDTVSDKLSEICLANEDSTSLAEGVRSMYSLSKEEVFDSLMKTLESEDFEGSKEVVIKMISEDKIDEAFALVLAMQRAMMRTITMVLYNPFYDIPSKK